MAAPPRPGLPAKPAAKPAGSPAERAEVLVSVMDRLAGVLAREMDLVRCGVLAGVTALQTDKRELTGRLDEVGRLLRLDRAGLAALPPDLLERLRQSARRLAELTAASADQLSIQVAAQTCILEVVVRTVKQGRRSETAYGQLGKACRSAVPGSRDSRSLAFNATL